MEKSKLQAIEALKPIMEEIASDTANKIVGSMVLLGLIYFKLLGILEWSIWLILLAWLGFIAVTAFVESAASDLRRWIKKPKGRKPRTFLRIEPK